MASASASRECSGEFTGAASSDAFETSGGGIDTFPSDVAGTGVVLVNIMITGDANEDASNPSDLTVEFSPEISCLMSVRGPLLIVLECGPERSISVPHEFVSGDDAPCNTESETSRELSSDVSGDIVVGTGIAVVPDNAMVVAKRIIQASELHTHLYKIYFVCVSNNALIPSTIAELLSETSLIAELLSEASNADRSRPMGDESRADA